MPSAASGTRLPKSSAWRSRIARPPPSSASGAPAACMSDPHADAVALMDRGVQPARNQRVAAAVHLVDHPLELPDQLLVGATRRGRDDRVGGDELLVALG